MATNTGNGAAGQTTSLMPFVNSGLHILLGIGRKNGGEPAISQEQEIRALLARVLMDPKEATQPQEAQPMLLSHTGLANQYLSNLAAQLGASVPNTFKR
jgi:hypothetical protein